MLAPDAADRFWLCHIRAVISQEGQLEEDVLQFIRVSLTRSSGFGMLVSP